VAVRTEAEKAPAETSAPRQRMEEDEAIKRCAPDLLGSRLNNAYKAALEAVAKDTQTSLAREPDQLDEGEEPATADAEGLRCFLEGEVLPWPETRKKELANRLLIREQALAEALDPLQARAAWSP